MASILDCRTARSDERGSWPGAARDASPTKAPPWCSPIATRRPERRRGIDSGANGADVSHADVEHRRAQRRSPRSPDSFQQQQASPTRAISNSGEISTGAAVNLKSMPFAARRRRAMVKQGIHCDRQHVVINAVVAIPNQVPYVVRRVASTS
jgi:hypothetical protein